MDVTFTNVLEGARQYFQGLPTASTSTGGGGTNPPNGGVNTSYQDGHHRPTEPDLNPELPPSSNGPYWPPQEANRVPSSDPSRPPSHHYQYHDQQHQQQQHQQHHQFQFPRPQSREAPSNHQYYQEQQMVPTSQYHQLQNVNYYQKTYYQMQPKSAASQENAYYKHLYTSQQQQQQQQQQQKQQEYRTSHNLPPIATLSLISYHSTVRTSNPKTKTIPTNAILNQKSASQVRSSYQETDYRNSTHQQQQQYHQQNRMINQNYQYNNNNSNNNTTQVIMSTSTTSTNYHQSSSSQYYQPNKPTMNQNINGRIAPIIKQKRESPLDLSVKTVRTPADSTLDDEDRKYYRTNSNTSSVSSQNYPTYDVYANSFQRNINNRQIPTATAPKVEFHPNFQMNYRRPNYNNSTTNRYPTVSVPTAAHVNSYIQSNNVPSRMEYQKNVPIYQEQKKRPADTVPSMIPNKITKVDTWKQKLDQQIEQRFNSYQQQLAKNKMINGNYHQQQPQQQHQQYQYHNQTYVPSATAHQYPGYQYPTQYRNNTNNNQIKSNNVGGADKRVLSLLRNSLEIKEQKKLEQKYDNVHKSRLDIQHPSTDVTAPLQPKPGFINRHNVSPFTPTNLPDNNNSLMYKLHIPKAIDSVNFDSDSNKLEDSQSLIHTNPTNDLDGLAALVAARIRTKAELKQVENGSPPKLNKEKSASFAPRRRLFSRSEDDNSSNVPLRDKTGLRSSSETSVFDFPDTDSESEMPVLERQTLEDMRRDRRSSTKVNEVSCKTDVPFYDDGLFSQTCDSFMEQLKNGSGKKRGRRKKIEADVLAKLESVTKEKPIIDNKLDIVKPAAKKPIFGDGSHFYPGWEEEVYKYKKSLRMPPSLIHVTRPPQYHRLSTSLPDLDPYPNSPIADDNNTKDKTKDSDNESDHSFNIFKNNYDSEGSSSIKSTKDSILDRLLEKYGGRKKKKHKRTDSPKTTPKSEKSELLPTPGYRDDEKVDNRVSIKEVFGEDRPASAPPVTCLDNIKIKEEPDDDITLSNLIKKEFDTKQVLKNKLLNRGRKDNLLKSLVDKKIKSELLDDDDSKSETPSIDGDESNQSSKKHRNRNIRRKFSSGFDYIRKKKKQKKDENEVKRTKGKFSSKSNPGSIQDIQKEIKGWVLNKGIGETILHRAARLGYTDITAYCLEKMECSPSPKDNAGYTPLHEASTKGNLAIAKMLLMYGANVSESARGGIRPLHEAVENGYVEIVRLLLSYGADPMLATYSGMTPLALSTDETTTKLLQYHIDDIEGKAGPPWEFVGPASCFDLKETGFDVLADVPSPDPASDEEDIEFEVSDSILPNLYTLRGESQTDRWILLQDLSSLLKIKSRDALLRQISPSGSTLNHKSVLRELKMSDFLEQAHCCQFLNIGEKVNTRASKIALIKYTDKVRELLNVEKVTISVR